MAYDIFGSAISLGFVALSIATLVLFVWALVSVIQTPFGNQNTKLIWILVILFASFIGPLIWLVWGRKNAF